MLVCSLLLCSRLHGRLIAPYTACTLTVNGPSLSRSTGALPTSRTASSSTSSGSSGCCGSPGALSRSSSNGWLPVVPSLEHAGAQQLQQPLQPHASCSTSSPTLPSTSLPPVSYCIHAWLETAAQQSMGSHVSASSYAVSDHEQLLAPRANTAAAAAADNDDDQAQFGSLNGDSSDSSNSEAWLISASIGLHRTSSLQQQFTESHAGATAAQPAAAEAMHCLGAVEQRHDHTGNVIAFLSQSHSRAGSNRSLSSSMCAPANTPHPEQLLQQGVVVLPDSDCGRIDSSSSGMSRCLSGSSKVVDDSPTYDHLAAAYESVNASQQGASVATSDDVNDALLDAAAAWHDDVLSVVSSSSSSMNDTVSLEMPDAHIQAADASGAALSTARCMFVASSAGRGSQHGLVVSTSPSTAAEQPACALGLPIAETAGQEQGDCAKASAAVAGSDDRAAAEPAAVAGSDDRAAAEPAAAAAGADSCVMTRLGSTDSDWSMLSGST